MPVVVAPGTSVFLKTIVLISALWLSGCATIFKTDKGEVPVVVAPGTSVFLKTGDSLPVQKRRDGTQFVKIDPAENDVLVFKKDTNVKLVKTTEYIEGKWYWGNLFIFPGFLVDGFTGNWYSFEEISVGFSPEDHNFAQQQKINKIRYWDTLRGIFSDHPKVFVFGGWGVASPVYQVPVLGNVLAGGIGYRITPWLDLCGETELAGSLDPGEFNQGGAIVRTGATARLRPLSFLHWHGPYVHGGIGRFATELREVGRYSSSDQPIDTIPGIKKNIPGASFGLGYSGESFWIEWKHAVGLQAMQHPRFGEFTPSYSALTIGLNLYF